MRRFRAQFGDTRPVAHNLALCSLLVLKSLTRGDISDNIDTEDNSARGRRAAADTKVIHNKRGRAAGATGIKSSSAAGTGKVKELAGAAANTAGIQARCAALARTVQSGCSSTRSSSAACASLTDHTCSSQKLA